MYERPWYRKISPGASSVPARSEPTITVDAPARRLGDVAAGPNAAVGNDWNAVGCPSRVHDRGQLRDAHARDDPRRADRAGPNADLDGVGTGIDQCFRGIGRRDIARDDLRRVGERLHPLDCAGDVRVVAVGGVDDDAIASGVDQCGPGKARVADRSRSRGTQAPLGVLRRMRGRDGLLDILDGDQADAVIRPVDDKQLFDTPLMEDLARFGLGGSRAPSRDFPASSAR